MKTLNILKGDLDVVFVALNPTEEAKLNGAVFSTDRGFWNILEKAGLISKKANKYPLQEMANIVFRDKNSEHVNYSMGFADLVEDCYEKNSKNVKILKGTAIHLAENLIRNHHAKKIVLMGQKVVDAFAKDFPKGTILKWKNEKAQYGSCIGTIEIDNCTAAVYKVPFPVNNNIEDRHLYYRLKSFITNASPILIKNC
jgi:hypothetical protein